MVPHIGPSHSQDTRVSNNCHGWHWLPRRRQLVVTPREKNVNYLTVLIPKSYLVIPTADTSGERSRT
jgi:hypothetical protein